MKALLLAAAIAAIVMAAEIPRPPLVSVVSPRVRHRARVSEHARSVSERRAEVESPQLMQDLAVSTDLFARTGQWDLVLVVGDAYANGSFPSFRPDPLVAYQVYKCAAACPDPYVAGEAQAKMMDLYTRKWAREDIAGRRIPKAFADVVCRTAAARSGPNVARPKVAPTVHVDASPKPAPAPIPVPPVVVRSDAQNVHDHSVTTSIKNRLGSMNRAPKSTIEDIRVVLDGTELDSDVRARAERVLRGLRDTEHSAFGVSERHVAGAVWDEIQKITDDATRVNAVETFAKQLADGVERGSVVCSTGKIARMLGSLDGIGDAPATKPMWAVREELGSLASKVRDEVLDSPAARERYEEGDETLRSRMDTLFRDRAKATYVDRIGMSPDVMDPLIDMYAMGFA